jgi:hypothetical protein
VTQVELRRTFDDGHARSGIRARVPPHDRHSMVEMGHDQRKERPTLALPIVRDEGIEPTMSVSDAELARDRAAG